MTIAASDGSGVFVGGEWALAITKLTSPVWTAFGLSLGTAVADFSSGSVLRVTVSSTSDVELRVQLQSNLGGVVRTTELDQAFTIGTGTASYDFDFSGVVGSQIDAASVSDLIMFVNGGESMAWSGTV